MRVCLESWWDWAIFPRWMMRDEMCVVEGHFVGVDVGWNLCLRELFFGGGCWVKFLPSKDIFWSGWWLKFVPLRAIFWDGCWLKFVPLKAIFWGGWRLKFVPSEDIFRSGCWLKFVPLMAIFWDSFHPGCQTRAIAVPLRAFFWGGWRGLKSQASFWVDWQ